jgi:sugar transferase (PEP-CTERM/EpsH1 system associated)
MIQAPAQVEETARTLSAHPPAKPGTGPGRLRVLHVVPHLMPGGTEYVLLRLIKGLGAQEFEHRICATRGMDPDFAAQHGIEGDQVFVAGRHDLNYQFPFFRLARYMRIFRPHVVHTRNWGGLDAVPAARLARVPVVIHSEHGYEVESLSGIPLRRRLFRRAAYAMTDAVFTNSRELREYHARTAWTSVERIRVIYNGVDTSRFAPQPEARHRLRQELGFPPDSTVVASVGRIVPIKDHATLLKAAAVAAGRHMDIRVLLVGAGPELPVLQRLANELPGLSGRVLFFGASERVPELLSASDLFALPSLGEGMSNTLLEAMACGLPTVSTRVGGNPELVEEDRTGWLFPVGDVSALAGLLERLSRDSGLRQRLGAAARERAITRFGFEQMTANYRALYLEQAARRRVLPGWSNDKVVSKG